MAEGEGVVVTSLATELMGALPTGLNSVRSIFTWVCGGGFLVWAVIKGPAWIIAISDAQHRKRADDLIEKGFESVKEDAAKVFAITLAAIHSAETAQSAKGTPPRAANSNRSPNRRLKSEIEEG